MYASSCVSFQCFSPPYPIPLAQTIHLLFLFFFFFGSYLYFEFLPLLRPSLQHPFPSFDSRPHSAFVDAFSQITEQVTADHPGMGVHVWDLGDALNRSLTIDRLHPTVQGHVALGQALAGLLRPLVAGALGAVI